MTNHVCGEEITKEMFNHIPMVTFQSNVDLFLSSVPSVHTMPLYPLICPLPEKRSTFAVEANDLFGRETPAQLFTPTFGKKN